MTRKDLAAELGTALDAFSVPAPRADLTDRIVAAATGPAVRTTPRRDRRGGWKTVRRVVIGSVAAGMVSAAAVASGLLGAAGIRVPVLTAMLAPESVVAPVAKPKSVRQAVAAKPKVVAPSRETAPLVDQVVSADHTTSIAERRAERRAFVAQHPEVKPLVRTMIQKQRAFVRDNPEVRQLRRMPRAERRAALAERPELRAAVRANIAEQRAILATHPEAATALRTRFRERLAARRNRKQIENVAPPAEGNPSEPR